jgi:hypothetical protein
VTDLTVNFVIIFQIHPSLLFAFIQSRPVGSSLTCHTMPNRVCSSSFNSRSSKGPSGWLSNTSSIHSFVHLFLLFRPRCYPPTHRSCVVAASPVNLIWSIDRRHFCLRVAFHFKPSAIDFLVSFVIAQLDQIPLESSSIDLYPTSTSAVLLYPSLKMTRQSSILAYQINSCSSHNFSLSYLEIEQAPIMRPSFINRFLFFSNMDLKLHLIEFN